MGRRGDDHRLKDKYRPQGGVGVCVCDLCPSLDNSLTACLLYSCDCLQENIILTFCGTLTKWTNMGKKWMKQSVNITYYLLLITYYNDKYLQNSKNLGHTWNKVRFLITTTVTANEYCKLCNLHMPYVNSTLFPYI